MTASSSYDLIVIGGGSAGYAAARVATDRGKRVALIERGPFGGLCILKGCMPSKTLLRSSELAHLAAHSEALGVTAREIAIDYPAIIRRKDAIIRGFADYRRQEVTRRELLTLIDGEARFLDPHRVRVNDRELTAPRCVIATGSRVFVPAIPGLAERHWTSDEALASTTLPQRLVVIGGGVIACELGQHFARLGAQVTILQRGPHLLKRHDPEFGRALGGYFEEEGLTLHTDVQFHEVTRHGRSKMVMISTGNQKQTRRLSVHGDEILVAAGRTANIEGLDLEAAGVKGGSEGIVVDDRLRTSHPDIYAAGDVTCTFQLTHVAVAQGEIAASNALGGPARAADYRIVPDVVFSDPPFARVGLSEMEAARTGRPVLVAGYPYDDLGKAICTGQTKGFVKMLADPATGEILGVGLLGASAPELIHEAVIAMHYRATVADLMQIPHFHPTLAEIFTYPAEELAAKIQSTGAPSHA
ncbi:MAG: FAD-dependent oxidoreductase [Nitrospirae bacterium]|nr:FAD-dependent oxidoreductase [Nitrospirota bacterium]